MFGLGWPARDGYGWGIFATNIIIECLRAELDEPVALDGFEALCVLPEERPYLESWGRRMAKYPPGPVPFPVLYPLGNHLVGPPRHWRGSENLGIVAFEDTKIPLDRVRDFDGYLATSSWNASLLEEAGAANVRTTTQGIDGRFFYPRPKQGRFQNRFVIYSGGKLEFRKGQDLTIAAFRAFHARHPDALLLTTWNSPWPQLAASMVHSKHVCSAPQLGGAPGTADALGLDAWLVSQGLPVGSFVNLAAMPNRDFSRLLAECDGAVMPSRAEGATNLVAMECLASGLPVVLSNNTGHQELVDSVPCLPLQHQQPVTLEGEGTLGWGESDVEEIVDHLEWIYQNRDAASSLGASAAAVMARDWSWAARVGSLVEAMSELRQDPRAAA